jgi:hypothetical protein
MRLPLLAVLAIPLLLAGCNTLESVKPLSSPQSATPDRRLEGLWTDASSKNSSGYVYIAYPASGPGSLMMLGKDNDKGLQTLGYTFFVTRTPLHNYLNLSHLVETSEGKTHTDNSDLYSFVEYHFSPAGHLVYSTVGGEAFSKAVESGRLKGKVTRDPKTKSPTGTTLTDSSERILSFIESAKPTEVFEQQPQTLEKIGAP